MTYRPGTLPAVLAAVWAVLMAGYLATEEFDVPGTDGTVGQQTLIEAGGWLAAVLIVLPVAISAGPFAVAPAQRRPARLAAAVLLCLLWLLAPFVLLPVVPAIALLALAGWRTPRNPD